MTDQQQPDSRRVEESATRVEQGMNDAVTDFEVAEQPVATSIAMLGEYLLLEPIGKGGMGLVYRAEHRTMNRQVAVKVLSSTLASNPSFIDQFFAEIRATAKLMHPNIVTGFDAGQINGVNFLAMELVEGETLSSRVHRLGVLNCNEAVHILEQAAAALQSAHEQGIVHRDIKPGNMMVTKEGRLKILDFGLAHLSFTQVGRSAGCIMGTPEYMAPEQFEEGDQVDGRTDLYSLGATLFYLLCGRPMYSGKDLAVARQNHLQPAPALYLQRADVDLRLDAIYQRLIAKSPAGRFQSAGELLQALHRQGLRGSWNQQPAFQPLGIGLGRLSDHPTSVASEATVVRQSQMVAIDLGLLATTAAFYDPHAGPQLIQLGASGFHMRNMIWSTKEQLRIGSGASEMRMKAPQLTVHSLQRAIGTKRLERQICGEHTPPEVGLAAIIKTVMQHAASVTDNSNSAVVTVPACYDQLHRRSVRDACQIAGIHRVQLLDKPLAAGLNWLDLNSRLLQAEAQGAAIDSHLLYVHLGGSGLEAACVRIHGNSVQMLSASGDWKLGSQRWQHLLTEYFIDSLQQLTGQSVRQDVAASTRLQRTIEFAMERLTRMPRVEVRFDWQGKRLEQVITQQGLVKVAPDLCAVIGQVVHEACANAKLKVSDMHHLLLAGSIFHMRPVREILLREFSPSVDVTVLEKSDLVRGAALQAYAQSFTLPNQSENLYRARSCTAYPIAVLPEFEGLPSKSREIIGAGQSLPVTINRTIRPSGSSQQSRVIKRLNLIEGTRLGDQNWRLLSEALPCALFPGRDADAPLLLHLEIDESGILSSSLSWPDGNLRRQLPPVGETSFTADELKYWRQWLETAMLCAGQ